MTEACGPAGADRAAARSRLAALLDAAAAGQFPPADGAVTILAQPSDRDAGVIALTGCSLIFADADPGWIAAQLPPDDLSASLSARFLHGLGERLARQPHSVDMLTCAAPLAGPSPADLVLADITADSGLTHPRIARARRYRDSVRVWQTDGGVLTLGRGVAGRWEVSIEVDPAHRDRGLGTRLAIAARQLVPAGAPLWAQIAPGNAASVRAFLRAGFRPIGAEALLSPDPAV